MWNVRLSFAMYRFYTNVLIALEKNNSKVQFPVLRGEGRGGGAGLLQRPQTKTSPPCSFLTGPVRHHIHEQ